eukprot:734797-Pelagomonas_calceolata.AAC.1
MGTQGIGHNSRALGPGIVMTCQGSCPPALVILPPMCDPGACRRYLYCLKVSLGERLSRE